jgi:hypothetical protein
LWLESALIEGMRRNSASSSNHGIGASVAKR